MIDPERLRSLNALLEQALALPPAERDGWLAAISAPDQTFVPELRRLLQRAAAETDSFMRQPAGAALDALAGAEAPADQPGDLVGPYRLMAPLGEGGMATVWCALRSDGSLEREVALKLPHVGATEGLARRMARERDLLAALEHPHIARLYDAGVTEDGRPWLAMERVSGLAIDEHVRRHCLDPAAVLHLALQVCAALAHAHGRLIVHRDLKPSNILVTHDGEVRLLDFGIGKLLQGEQPGTAPTAITQFHGRAMTPDYASPEQVAGRPVTVATDVYSLGVVLYELLTGQRPYRLGRQSTAALEEAILAADVPLASSRCADRTRARALRGDLDAVLAKALAKEPDRRYASVESLAADLRAHLEGLPVAAQAPSRLYRSTKFMRRHRWPLAGATVVALSVLGGAASSLWHARQASEHAALAQARLRNAEGLLDFTNAVLMHGLKPGETVTLEELMRRSESVIVDSLGRKPVDRALATEMLAEWHTLFGNTGKSRELLQSALAQLPAEADAALTERLRCLSAETLSFAGDPQQAIAELEQVLARPSGDPSARITCELRRANLERNASNREQAMRWALAAEATLKRIDQPSVKIRAWVENELGNALVVNGKPAQGVRHLGVAVATLEQAGPSQDLTLIFTLTDRAISLVEAGQHLAAVRDLQRAERIASERLPRGDVPAGVLVNLGNALRSSGQLDQAGDAYQRAVIAARRDGIPGMEAAAELGLASTELARASPRLATVAPRLDTASRILDRIGMPEGAPVRGGIGHVKALLKVASGDLVQGDAELATLAQRYDKFNASSSLARVLAYRAEIALKHGDLDRASSLLATALQHARRPQGDFETSAAVANVLIGQAEVAMRRGQTETAADLARQALHHAVTSAGNDHPVVARAHTLLGR